jgi:regulator of sirC expression with transglutaminase-like and TPR domain
MIIHELWSPDDDARADACLRAVEEHDLAEALLSVEGAPAEVARRVKSQLSGWGRALAGRLGSQPSPPQVQARALAGYLGDELGFRGDVDDYYHAQNSRLSEVISRRRGLPILLSAVWMEVGAIAGIQVEGVGMPGHFIARVGGAGGQLIDPFGGGRLLSVDDCQRIVREMSQGNVPWRDDHLATTEPKQMLERVLANLVQAYGRTNETISLYRTLTLLARVRPDVPSYCLKRAAAAEALGARGQAAQIYADIIRRYPGSQEASLAQQRHDAARAKHAWN